jgi:peptidoglycan/xylan/chitin deacetylase (PgdA/CDA1 family)
MFPNVGTGPVARRSRYSSNGSSLMLLGAEISRLAKLLLEGLLIIVGVIAYHLGLATTIVRLGGPRPRVLMYHACEEVESDFLRGLAINTRPARLAAQLDFVAKHYQIIPVEELTRGAVPGRALAITFDDGFRSVYLYALPLLASRGVPATCYLVTDRLDDRSPIWINEMNWYLRRHGSPARSLVARRLGAPRLGSMPVFIGAVINRFDRAAIAQLLVELEATFGPPELPGRLHLDRAEIEEMARRGFRFGNHTASHPVLSRLEDSGCREEIARARDALARLPGSIDSLAHPFGLFGDATLRIARELDYTTLMDVRGDNDPLDLDHVARVNVGSDSPAVLFARMELVARLRPRLKRLIHRFFPGSRR